MENSTLQSYDKGVGANFLCVYCSQFSSTTQGSFKLFIFRMNAALPGEKFVTHVKMFEPAVLSVSLENLLIHYKEYCSAKGLHSPAIQNYESRCRVFLSALASIGISDSRSMTAGTTSKACLQRPNSSDFSTIRTFLKFLFVSGYLKKDYSSIIPRFKRPQPMPSVYSVQNVKQIEAKINCDTPFGKRNYAMLLSATRLGIRVGDIVTMTFDELDFQSETIRIIQNKTGFLLESPMFSCVRDALNDYIQNYRDNSDSKYAFLSLHPPFSAITVTAFGRYMRLALKDAGIEPG